MCDEIFTQTETLSTPNEMLCYGLLVLHVDLAWNNAIVTDKDWDSCLCGVDVEAILNRSGVKWKVDPFGYEILEDNFVG